MRPEELCTRCGLDQDECQCPYMFQEKSAAKSGTSVLVSGPAKRGIACSKCGCRTTREFGKRAVVTSGPGGCGIQNCRCHEEN